MNGGDALDALLNNNSNANFNNNTKASSPPQLLQSSMASPRGMGPSINSYNYNSSGSNGEVESAMLPPLKTMNSLNTATSSTSYPNNVAHSSDPVIDQLTQEIVSLKADYARSVQNGQARADILATIQGLEQDVMQLRAKQQQQQQQLQQQPHQFPQQVPTPPYVRFSIISTQQYRL
jgi:hypothetical protein